MKPAFLYLEPLTFPGVSNLCVNGTHSLIIICLFTEVLTHRIWLIPRHICTSELDAAIRRRFEKRVYIPLPDAEARAYMIQLNLGDTPNELVESDYETLGEITEGASGSDIKVLVKEALMEPLRRCQQAKQFIINEEGYYLPCEQYPNCPHCPPKLSSDTTDKDYACKRCGAVRMQLWDVPSDKLRAPLVKLKDFETTLKHSFSSVSEAERKRFIEWTKLFGQDGA